LELMSQKKSKTMPNRDLLVMTNQSNNKNK